MNKIIKKKNKVIIILDKETRKKFTKSSEKAPDFFIKGMEKIEEKILKNLGFLKEDVEENDEKWKKDT